MRKLSKIFLAFFLASFLLLFNAQVYAATDSNGGSGGGDLGASFTHPVQNCKVPLSTASTWTFRYSLDSKKQVVIDVNTNGITTTDKDGNPLKFSVLMNSGINPVDSTINNQGKINFQTTTTLDSVLGNTNEDVTVQLFGPDNNMSCYDTFKFSEFSPGGTTTDADKFECSINFSQDSYTPQESIGYKVLSGLVDTTDPNARSGVTIVSGKGTDVSTIMNTCEKNSDLANSNGPYVNIHTYYGSNLPAGEYTLNVYQGCFDLTTTADGASKRCSQNFNVCSDHKCLPAGTACTPDDPKTTNTNENTCGKDAPFCIDNPNAGQRKQDGTVQPANICATTPTYEQKCNTKGHSDQCNTAIGWFGYSPEAFFKSVVQIFLALGGTILLFTIILNGYRFMASQGDPEKVKEAKEAITSAIGGLLIIIFSLVILQFITSTVLHLPGFN